MSEKKSSKGIKDIAYTLLDKLGSWLLIVVIAIIMTFSSDKFLTSANFINVLRQVAVVLIAAIGISFVILGGGFDLSTGMNATFAGCNAALLMKNLGWSVPAAILAAVFIGVVLGTLNGLVVTYLKVPPFIATLGMQYIIQGLIFITTNSMPINGLPESFNVFGRGYVGVIPVPVIIMLIFVAIGQVILKYTKFGRSVIAVGENETAAKLSGLNVNITKVAMYSFCGFCVACAGIVLASRMSSGQPSSGGDMALQGIAAVYIGGTFKGSIINTMAGTLVWGFMNNALNLLNVDAYWQKVVLGIIIIAAVLFDTFRANLAAKQKK